MENNLKVFKSDKFDVVDTAGLSLFLYPNSLFIFAKNKNQANICIHYYLDFRWEMLESLFGTDPLLRQDVPVRVYLHQPNFILIPGMLFQQGNEESYLAFSQELAEDVHSFSSPLDSNNIQMVSCIPAKLKKNLDARFGEVTLHHGGCSFLSYLFKERFNLIGQEIVVNYFETHIYLAVFTNQDLRLFNMFEISYKQDILKYVLIVIGQLQIDRNHARVSLAGATTESGITEAWAGEYFPNFRLISPHANQTYPHGFKNLKEENALEIRWQYD